MRRSWGGTAARLVAAAAALFALMLALGVLLVHVLAHGWVGRTDDALERRLLAGRTPTWDTVTNVVTQLAQPLTVAGAAVVVVLVLALVTRRWAPPLFLAATVGVESAVYFGTSTLVHRDRPSIPRLGMADPRASYPSGHVAASVCLYGGVAVLAWVLARRRTALVALLTVAAVLVPPAVGLCRMYRGFHHLSDVLAGALLGVLWLTATTRLLLLPGLRGDPASQRAPARRYGSPG